MGVKVLIVEDEILVSMQLEDILTDAGHQVVGVVAERGQVAAIGEPPQVALVDVNLRDGRTGPLVADHLAAAFGTRVVYVTANPQQIGHAAPHAIGVVQKPFSEAVILAAIEYARDGAPAGRRPPGVTPICGTC